VKKKETTTQSATQSSDPVVQLLGTLDRGPLSSAEIRDRLNLKHRPTLRKNYLHPALEKGYVEMTIPENPKPAAKIPSDGKGQQVAVSEKIKTIKRYIHGY